MPTQKVCQFTQNGSLARQRRNEKKCNKYLQNQNAPIKPTSTKTPQFNTAARKQNF